MEGLELIKITVPQDKAYLVAKPLKEEFIKRGLL